VETITFNDFALMMIIATATAAMFGGFIAWVMQEDDDE
jgi:hypothetical protein